MGYDTVDSMLYAINRETREKIKIGSQVPKLALGGIQKENINW